MKQLVFICSAVLFSFACKKLGEIPEHRVQFQSNSSVGHYTLTINGEVKTDLNETYTLPGNSVVDLKLLSSGGHVVNVNGEDKPLVTGTIYVDGKAVKSGSAYSDVELTYTIP